MTHINVNSQVSKSWITNVECSVKILRMPELLFERTFHPLLPPQMPPAVSSVWEKHLRGSPEHKARSVLIHNMLENSLQELGDFCNDSASFPKSAENFRSQPALPLPWNFPFPPILESAVYFVNFLRAKNIIFISWQT